VTDGPPTVLPYPLPDDLPAGQGGLAIHSRQRDGFPAPMIGVDGRPVLREFGDAVVVLPPGPHIVEVQLGEPVRSALVTIRAGQLTTFSYSSADALGTPSRLGNRRRVGTGPNPGRIVLAALVFAVTLLVGRVVIALAGVDNGLSFGVVALVAVALSAVSYYALIRRRR